jgi:hypothetical protein
MTLKRLERLRSKEIERLDDYLAALTALKRKFHEEFLTLQTLQREVKNVDEGFEASLDYVMNLVAQLNQIQSDEKKEVRRLTKDLVSKQNQQELLRKCHERELESKNQASADITAIEAHKNQILTTKWFKRHKIQRYLNETLLSNAPPELDALALEKNLFIDKQSRKAEKLLKDLSVVDGEIEQLMMEIKRYELSKDWGESVSNCLSELVSLKSEIAEFAIDTQVPLQTALSDLQTLYRKEKSQLKAGLFDEELVEIDDQRLEKLRKTKEKNRKLKEAQEIQISRQQNAVIKQQISQKREANKYIETHKNLEKEYSVAESELRKSTDKVKMLKKKRSRLVTRFGDVSPLNGRPEDYIATWNRYELLKPWPRLITILRSIDVVDEDLSEAREAVQRDEKELKGLEVKVEKLRNYRNIASKELMIVNRIGLGSNSKRPKVVVTEWRHAEELARDFMRWLGYVDAELTNQGADGGVDVTSRGAIGQVKMHSNGVRRPDIQALVGEAAVINRTPLFFAMNYSKEAVTWSNEHDIAIFKFSRNGDVVAVSEAALKLEARSQK